MTIIDWIIFAVICSLIPVCLYISKKQHEKYKQWAEEDKKAIKEFIESQKL